MITDHPKLTAKIALYRMSSVHFYGRLLRVDLMKWVSNLRPPVRTSVRPQKVSSILTKFNVYVEVDE